MEKLSSDIIHLALKCHVEIKHEDALFRKHQNNLFQGKKKKVLCLEAWITKFNEVHAYWQTRLVSGPFFFVFCYVFEVASVSWGPWDWAIPIQLTPTPPEWEAGCISACLSCFSRMMCWGQLLSAENSDLSLLKSLEDFPLISVGFNQYFKEGLAALPLLLLSWPLRMGRKGLWMRKRMRKGVSERALYFSQWLGGCRNKTERKRILEFYFLPLFECCTHKGMSLEPDDNLNSPCHIEQLCAACP